MGHQSPTTMAQELYATYIGLVYILMRIKVVGLWRKLSATCGRHATAGTWHERSVTWRRIFEINLHLYFLDSAQNVFWTWTNLNLCSFIFKFSARRFICFWKTIFELCFTCSGIFIIFKLSVTTYTRQWSALFYFTSHIRHSCFRSYLELKR